MMSEIDYGEENKKIRKFLLSTLDNDIMKAYSSEKGQLCYKSEIPLFIQLNRNIQALTEALNNHLALEIKKGSLDD